MCEQSEDVTPERNSESSDLIKEGCLCGEENVAWQNEPDFGQLEY